MFEIPAVPVIAGHKVADFSVTLVCEASGMNYVIEIFVDLLIALIAAIVVDPRRTFDSWNDLLPGGEGNTQE